jgi:hypothetical protein
MNLKSAVVPQRHRVHGKNLFIVQTGLPIRVVVPLMVATGQIVISLSVSVSLW